MGLGGLLIGQAAGWFIGIVIGAKYVKIGFARPAKEQFESLYEYAKYSWIGNLKSRTFNDIDTVILGFFVPATLVGVYSVVWGIAVVLMTFNKSISGTLFPEISHADAQDELETVASLITDGIRYNGLLLIPGVVGGSILADRLLLIYGPEFSQGTAVIGFLLLAVLLYGYAHQLLNSLNAIGRPDLTFRINFVFIVFNIVSNVILVQIIGWIGAALATMFSAAIGLMLSFKALQREVRFSIPKKEIFKQVAAAVVMGCIVYMGYWIESTYSIISQNTATVLILVFIGAIFYFITLLVVSLNFRQTIVRNIPENLLSAYI
jgi:O-antigen/teichoic acid export membrane protein